MTPPLPRTTKPCRVVAYLRCSTEGQARDGVSLDVQRARVQAQAVASDLQLVEVHEDAASGKSLDRPGLQAALRALDEGRADALLVLKLDRLTRSVRDLGHLLDGYFRDRFALLSVMDSIDTRTAGGRLVLNVLASVSEWERETIGERTRTALAHIKAQGRKLGRRPLEEVREDGAATVARAVELKRQGLTLRAVAERLELEGRPTSRGGRWGPAGVLYVLRRAGAA